MLTKTSSIAVVWNLVIIVLLVHLIGPLSGQPLLSPRPETATISLPEQSHLESLLSGFRSAERQLVRPQASQQQLSRPAEPEMLLAILFPDRCQAASGKQDVLRYKRADVTRPWRRAACGLARIARLVA
jgi:hypothetical protein